MKGVGGASRGSTERKLAMKRWMKWTIVAAVLAIPGLAWAGTKLMSDDCGCPICHCPDCSCAH